MDLGEYLASGDRTSFSVEGSFGRGWNSQSGKTSRSTMLMFRCRRLASFIHSVPGQRQTANGHEISRREERRSAPGAASR